MVSVPYEKFHLVALYSLFPHHSHLEILAIYPNINQSFMKARCLKTWETTKTEYDQLDNRLAVEKGC